MHCEICGSVRKRTAHWNLTSKHHLPFPFEPRSDIHRNECCKQVSEAWKCGVRGIGQVAKLPAARADVRLTRAFGSGTVRQRACRRQGREGGLEMTVKEVTVREQQRRRMKHENGEGQMKRYDMRTANTLWHACTRCLYATQRNCVRKMCATRSVYTSRRTHSSCHYVGDFVVPLPS